ncbi:MAG: TolC family protein, partial [Candidatus Omnitrophica bacterium]|nr:TolC family protein [Candidatus Omnitrophota bacterium]
MKSKLIFTLMSIFLNGLFNNVYASAETLTWGACVKEAAKNNPDLIAAQESIKQSEALKQQATSGLFPQVTGSVDAST